MNTGNFLNTSHQSISWFVEQNNDGKLELRPPFQRRPVWTEDAKAFLIDSILRGYPVPEVYVQSIIKGDETRWAVVDGQQRLRACLEFLQDGFPVIFDVEKIQPLYDLGDTPWYGKKFSQLDTTEQHLFRRYKLIVRDLEDVDDQEVRHLFFRLNQSNVALNAQELRYSLYRGGFLEVVEQLTKRAEWDHFRIFTKMQQRRMLDSEFVSELVIGYLHFPQNKKDSLDAYYRQYSKEFPFQEEVEEKFTQTLQALYKLFPSPRFGGTRWYRKSDFYTLFLALARNRFGVAESSFDSVREALTRFGDLVGRPAQLGEPVAVAAYRDAVTRAATDRGRRIRREDALAAFINNDQFAYTAFPTDTLGDDEEPDPELDEEYADNDSP